LPIGGAMIMLTHWVVKETRDPNATRLDIARVVTFSGFLTLTTLALISGNKDGWSNAFVRAELVVGIVLLGCFLLVESRQTQPMVDLSFFRRPTYVGANIAGLAYAVSFLTMLTYLPVYFQNVMGKSAMESGF